MAHNGYYWLKNYEKCGTDFRDADIFFVLDSLSSEYIETLVRKLREETKQKIDWHWFAGHAILLTIGDIQMVLDTIVTHFNDIALEYLKQNNSVNMRFIMDKLLFTYLKYKKV